MTLKEDGDNISRVMDSIINSSPDHMSRDYMSVTLTISNRLGTISSQEILFIRCKELIYFDTITAFGESDLDYWVGANVPIVGDVPTNGFRGPEGLADNFGSTCMTNTVDPIDPSNVNDVECYGSSSVQNTDVEYLNYG